VKTATPPFVQELRDMLAPWGEVDLTRFFGGHGLRHAGVQFAFVMKGRLWLRADAALRETLRAQGGGEAFSYAGGGGREVKVPSYCSAPPDALEDADELRRVSRLAWESARRG
jgi:DNA transformation protein